MKHSIRENICKIIEYSRGGPLKRGSLKTLVHFAHPISWLNCIKVGLTGRVWCGVGEGLPLNALAGGWEERQALWQNLDWDWGPLIWIRNFLGWPVVKLREGVKRFRTLQFCCRSWRRFFYGRSLALRFASFWWPSQLVGAVQLDLHTSSAALFAKLQLCIHSLSTHSQRSIAQAASAASWQTTLPLPNSLDFFLSARIYSIRLGNVSDGRSFGRFSLDKCSSKSCNIVNPSLNYKMPSYCNLYLF